MDTTEKLKAEIEELKAQLEKKEKALTYHRAFKALIKENVDRKLYNRLVEVTREKLRHGPTKPTPKLTLIKE